MGYNSSYQLLSMPKPMDKQKHQTSVDRDPRENARGESQRLAQDFIRDIVGL